MIISSITNFLTFPLMTHNLFLIKKKKTSSKSMLLGICYCFSNPQYKRINFKWLFFLYSLIKSDLWPPLPIPATVNFEWNNLNCNRRNICCFFSSGLSKLKESLCLTSSPQLTQKPSLPGSLCQFWDERLQRGSTRAWGSTGQSTGWPRLAHQARVRRPERPRWGNGLSPPCPFWKGNINVAMTQTLLLRSPAGSTGLS